MPYNDSQPPILLSILNVSPCCRFRNFAYFWIIIRHALFTGLQATLQRPSTVVLNLVLGNKSFSHKLHSHLLLDYDFSMEYKYFTSSSQLYSLLKAYGRMLNQSTPWRHFANISINTFIQYSLLPFPTPPSKLTTPQPYSLSPVILSPLTLLNAPLKQPPRRKSAIHRRINYSA